MYSACVFVASISVPTGNFSLRQRLPGNSDVHSGSLHMYHLHTDRRSLPSFCILQQTSLSIAKTLFYPSICSVSSMRSTVMMARLGQKLNNTSFRICGLWQRVNGSSSPTFYKMHGVSVHAIVSQLLNSQQLGNDSPDTIASAIPPNVASNRPIIDETPFNMGVMTERDRFSSVFFWGLYL
jgi:hypothetical protein